MKNIFLVLFTILTYTTSTSQNSGFSLYDEDPIFKYGNTCKGATECFQQYIAYELGELYTVNCSGKFYVSFKINKEGIIDTAEILNYPKTCSENLKEAIKKLFTSSPKWTPAKLGDKNVEARYILPLNISAQ